MGGSGPKFAQAQQGVRLEDLTPHIKQQELEKRLGAAFDRAIRVVEADLRREALGYDRQLKITDLARMAEIINNIPPHISIASDFKLKAKGGTDEQVRGYTERLQDILSNEELTLAQSLEQMTKVVNEAKTDGITLTVIPIFKISVNLDFIKSAKNNFVQHVSSILRNGFGGQLMSPFELTFEEGTEPVARMLADALQKEIGVQRPAEFKNGQTRLAFDSVRVPKGHYPIEAKAEDNVLAIEWASWIAVGTVTLDMDKGAFLDKVPKRERPV